MIKAIKQFKENNKPDFYMFFFGLPILLSTIILISLSVSINSFYSYKKSMENGNLSFVEIYKNKHYLEKSFFSIFLDKESEKQKIELFIREAVANPSLEDVIKYKSKTAYKLLKEGYKTREFLESYNLLYENYKKEKSYNEHIKNMNSGSLSNYYFHDFVFEPLYKNYNFIDLYSYINHLSDDSAKSYYVWLLFNKIGCKNYVNVMKNNFIISGRYTLSDFSLVRFNDFYFNKNVLYDNHILLNKRINFTKTKKIEDLKIDDESCLLNKQIKERRGV